MMTVLPPPRFNPAAAFLYVIPLARRNASIIASSSDLYVHMRVPPSAGPKVVSWIAIIAFKPDCSSWQNKDRKSTRLNSSHVKISYAVFCLKKKKKKKEQKI